MQTPRLSWSFGEHSGKIPQIRIFYHYQSTLYDLYQGDLNRLVAWIDDAVWLQLNFNQTSVMAHRIKRLAEYIVFVPQLEAWEPQFGLASMTLSDYVNLKVPPIVIEAQQLTDLWHNLGKTDIYLATLEPINSTELAWLWLLSSQIPPAEQSSHQFASYAHQISKVIVAQEPEITPSISEFIQAILANTQAFSQTPSMLQNHDGKQITGYWLDQQQQVQAWPALWQRHEQLFFLLAGQAIAALNPYASLLQAKGTPLVEYLTNDIALRQADALHAIELIRALNKPISGCDVYTQTNDSINFNYHLPGCSINPRFAESQAEYNQRSWTITRNYIEHYPNPKHETLLFVLVLGKIPSI